MKISVELHIGVLVVLILPIIYFLVNHLWYLSHNKRWSQYWALCCCFGASMRERQRRRSNRSCGAENVEQIYIFEIHPSLIKLLSCKMSACQACEILTATAIRNNSSTNVDNNEKKIDMDRIKSKSRSSKISSQNTPALTPDFDSTKIETRTRNISDIGSGSSSMSGIDITPHDMIDSQCK